MSNARRPVPSSSVPSQPPNRGRGGPTTQTNLPSPATRPHHDYFHSLRKFKFHIAAAIALITLIVTAVTLLPAFWGAKYAKEALELARWTARKDYIEACQEVSDSNLCSDFRTSFL